MLQPLLRLYAKKWEPGAYRLKAVKFLLEHWSALLLLDPGLGKTSITLAAIRILKDKGLVKKTLIVAPIKVIELTWPNERNKWTDFHGLSMVMLHGVNKEEALGIEADIYLINPEGFDWLLGVSKTKGKTGKMTVTANKARWRSFGFDLVVFDEITKFKNHASGRFKAFKQVRRDGLRYWGLTGSPAAKGLLHLFEICYIVDGGETLGSFVTKWRSKFFERNFSGFGYTVREGAENEIYERIAPLALRMAAEDYVKMPSIVPNDIVVELPEAAMDVYKKLHNSFIAKLEEGVVTAANAGVLTNKLRQIANGAIYLDPEVVAMVKLPKSVKEWAPIHDEKLDALERLVEELQGTPLLVAYDYAHDLARLRERFGKDLPVLGSGTTTADTRRIEREWNRGDIPLLAAHPMAVAHGLNLQEDKKHVAWYSMIYDFELYDQFIRRVRRTGNDNRVVFVHRIMAKGTVDFAAAAALRSKDECQREFFKAIKKLQRM